ncbi:YybH family protein [Cognatilysobacter terrigena]|uniref:YybH family protein n=1 Tax=Cognatilysobacter terrigena TaxID=2488749 RepID=UPI00141527E5|nr:nuclear transport factor 2 family protein [Lysobacter terrigena]
MKTTLLLTALLLAAPTALAHEGKAHAAPASTPSNNDALAPVIATAERFGAAIKGADFDTVRTLLDEKVLILESGGAERSLEEYLGHHAIADAAFLAGATVKVTHRAGEMQGTTAWLATESEITPAAGSDAKPLLSTETLVMRKAGNAWRIVHVHWSSRTNKAATP